MKDRNKLAPLLRAFKSGHVGLEYSIDYILSIHSSSKRFNRNSFALGILAGQVVMYIIMKYIV